MLLCSSTDHHSKGKSEFGRRPFWLRPSGFHSPEITNYPKFVLHATVDPNVPKSRIPLKIGVNTRLLLKGGLEGIGWFMYETLSRIVQEHPEHEFLFFFDRPYSDQYIFGDNVRPVVVSPPARHPFLFYLWFEWSLPPILRKFRPDLFVSPDGFLSLASNIPQLGVIHDLNFEHYPRDMPYLQRSFYKTFFPRYARKADRLVTVSEASKADIVEQYGIPEEKIDVVYNGADPSFSPLDEEAVDHVRQEFAGGDPYFLFVGALHPRKNIARMVRAFQLFRGQTNEPYKLVLAGNPMWWTSAMNEALNGLRDSSAVIFTGHLERKDLQRLVGAAEAMIYVSTFEGFGIPMVEAMRSGVPVIASNISSMPEVAGDAAIFVDPFSVDSIAHGMERIRSDEYVNEIREKGLQRGQAFSWDRTASLFYESMMKTVQHEGVKKSERKG